MPAAKKEPDAPKAAVTNMLGAALALNVLDAWNVVDTS